MPQAESGFCAHHPFCELWSGTDSRILSLTLALVQKALEVSLLLEQEASHESSVLKRENVTGGCPVGARELTCSSESLPTAAIGKGSENSRGSDVEWTR